MTHAVKNRPAIGIMGEFSAGKSTLSNLLIGSDRLPQKVTATRLPPVRLTFGEKKITRVLQDGSEEIMDVDDLGEVPFEGTKYILCHIDTPVLEQFDLIDFPGISDPNMPVENWESMISEVSGIIWCTHSTQSWRQSEAGLWETIPDIIRQNSVLLITRFDKLKTDLEKSRVLKRVTSEAGHLFEGIYPIALLDALSTERGSETWVSSGAEAFYAAFERMNSLPPSDLVSFLAETDEEVKQPNIDQISVPSKLSSEPQQQEAMVEKPVIQPRRILPRRVKSSGSSSPRERPPAITDSERQRQLEELLSGT